MAIGAVAVASGLIPGPGGIGPRGSDSVQAGGGPSMPGTGALPSGSASAPGADEAGSRPDSRPTAPSRPSDDSPEKPPSPRAPSAGAGKEKGAAGTGGNGAGGNGPSSGGTGAGQDRSGPERSPENSGGSSSAAGQERAAEAEVLSLVNQERAGKGCPAVRPDADLAALAGAFSEDMAERGFFDHTSPDGAGPWDRAEERGITDLGGENIARGQANAQSVMDSWMNSPGHRANILNCDYRTLGVGAHFAPGGPWWTQDFGF